MCQLILTKPLKFCDGELGRVPSPVCVRYLCHEQPIYLATLRGFDARHLPNLEASLYSNSTRRRKRGPEGDDDVGIVQQEQLALKKIAKR